MASLPSDRTKLALAQSNQTPGNVAASTKNINALTESYDTIDALYNYATGLVSASTLSRLGVINVKDYNASGLATTAAGSITTGTKLLTLTTTPDFLTGQGIGIAGAGVAAANLISTVASISGLVITLADAASTTVAAAVVSHNDSVAVQAANDAANALGGGTLLFPEGTYLANFILDTKVNIIGQGSNISTIKSVSGSNADVIQGRSFLTLTGTAKAVPETRGIRNNIIRDIKIDGNKANNTAGYGIRIWGCSWKWYNVIVQECVNDGIWTEFTTHDDPNTTNPTDPSYQSLESNFNHIRSLGNGGNGWTYKGPHDSVLTDYVAFSNTAGTALTTTKSIAGSNWNSWENLNSYYFGASAKVNGIVASAANVGTGVEILAGVGSVQLTNATIAGHVSGAILRGSNHLLKGYISSNKNAGNTAGDGIILDAAIGCVIDVVADGNWNFLNSITEAGINFITAYVNVPTGKTLTSGTALGSTDYLNLVAVGGVTTKTFQLPSRTIHAGGWAPILPTSNGTILATDSAPSGSSRGGSFKGTATMLASGTSVVVTHGLGVAPTSVVCTAQGDIGATWITAIDTTHFTINCASAPVGDTVILWVAS